MWRSAFLISPHTHTPTRTILPYIVSSHNCVHLNAYGAGSGALSRGAIPLNRTNAPSLGCSLPERRAKT